MDTGSGHIREPLENIGQPGLRIDVVHFGGDNQRIHEGCPLTTTFRSGE